MATIPAPSAILNAPASGARASRTVFADSGFRSFVPPSLVSFRCQARDRLRCHVPDPPGAEMGLHVVVGVMPVVEPGLGREPAIGVEPVEVKGEQFVDCQRARRWPQLAPIDLSQQFPASAPRLSRGLEPAPGDLRAPAGQRVAPDADLHVPPAVPVLVHALWSARHRRTSLRTVWFSTGSHSGVTTKPGLSPLGL
jgi:hypothetical protein